MSTTDQHISAAFRGDPAPTTITPRRSPIAEVLTTYPATVANALEEAARAFMTELQLKDGHSPADALFEVNLQIQEAYKSAVQAGHDDMSAANFATRFLEKRTAYYRGRTPLSSDRAVAEAASHQYTPKLVRDIREGA